MITDFLAFDVETANSSPDSVCSLGYVLVKERKIIKKTEYLICPPDLRFSVHNTAVHKLCEEDVEHAPTIADVWQEVSDEFRNYPIVAHNASFDTNCLEASLRSYGISLKMEEVHCTYQMSGKGLSDLCKELGISLDHHNALADAVACAMIFDQLMNDSSSMSMLQQQKAKQKEPEGYHTRIKSKFLKPVITEENAASPFCNKKVVITGVFARYERNQIAEMLFKAGADIDTSVTKRTDFLVAGNNMGPAKRQKAEKYEVRILGEDDFAKMIGDA